jgi:three-Cys-motif partner protein
MTISSSNRNKEAFSSLELTLKLSEHAKRLGNSIHLFNDSFAAHSARIIEFVNEKSRSGRAIFVLDQCGYDKVPFACIRNIMHSIPNAEIILTFAADFLIDYLREGLPNRQLRSLPELDLDIMNWWTGLFVRHGESVAHAAVAKRGQPNAM